ncbi:uncharacterized protein LOC126320361 [Schistocerca gregaria]|uniref:uncharacterized protein LOC126320361 n=1 Tax=Schistocerca gregaria TaxID=7010 RepID=UPI00211F35B7|nr:uncharacterized protein LOC126320361 [Schistocerca gregaria]
MCMKLDLRVLMFRRFGKRLIVSHGISPDAFVQLALHVTCYKMFGELKSTYESCSTRRFYHGRTECLRSLTSEVARFVEVVGCARASAEEQVAAARAAFEAHAQRAKECQAGEGVDRHMWGLQSLARVHQSSGYAKGACEGFEKLAVWNRMLDSFMSTSNSGNEYIECFAFGPTSRDGLGIGYVIHPERVCVCVTSFKQNCAQFSRNLERTLVSLGELFECGKCMRLSLDTKF